ncbi:hypothetical protein [Streptomyces sp. NPDC102264]|uniref:hypothetical protein n=1 Tax=Streptomyces sp. NPDC102264 TaxID=3366149 RepID=UPI0037FB9A70
MKVKQWGVGHPGACLAAKLGVREVMTALLERNHHLVRAGQVILLDRGGGAPGVRAAGTPALT